MTPDKLISAKFQHIFRESPTVSVIAPGRVNLIGEHTDYNDGFVLPAAIDKVIAFAASRRTDFTIRLVAADLNDSVELALHDLQKTDRGWANYLIGVTKELLDTGAEITSGFNVVFGGNVPLGSGLSSSAAVESGMGFVLNVLFDLGLNRKQLALTAQNAEHNFAGVNCGIMDMYASLFGKENHVIRLDCRSITHDYFPFDFPDYSIVLCNTGVKHNLGDSEYNTRRRECEEGVQILKTYDPAIRSLRDVSVDFFTKHRKALPLNVMKRCRYVVCENERVNLACQALYEGDLHLFGFYMYQTHAGLRDDYEVSCPELDFLVESTKPFSYVLGSRMMGGGFGGCTINIVQENFVEDFIRKQKTAYQQQFGRDPETYTVRLTDGVRECPDIRCV